MSRSLERRIADYGGEGSGSCGCRSVPGRPGHRRSPDGFRTAGPPTRICCSCLTWPRTSPTTLRQTRPDLAA